MNIFKTYVICFLLIICFVGISNAQVENYENENEIILAADNFFNKSDYLSAIPLYSHLLSLDRKSNTYKYRFAVCILNVRKKDSELALKYLKQINSLDFYDDQYHYYLGYAYHLNYRFKEAIDAYSDYQLYAKKPNEEFFVDRKIDMCERAMYIINDINDLYVINNSNVPINGFYRSYNLSDFGGVFLKKPKELISRLDKKDNQNSIVFYSEREETVFYSSYGKNGNTGKDIYMAKMIDGKISEPVFLKGINTSLDEDYPYYVSDGGVLYFSSKGHSSIGGYDIFYSVYDSTHLKWSKPIALKFAINTPYNDFLFVSDIEKEYACFASDRNSDMDMVSVYRVRIDKKPEENEFEANSMDLSLDKYSSNYNATVEYLNEYSDLWVNIKEDMFAEIEEEYYQKSYIKLDENISTTTIVDTAFNEYNIIKKEYEEFLKIEKAAFALSNDKIDKVKSLENYISTLQVDQEEYNYYNLKLEEAVRVRDLSISTTKSIETLVDNKRIELDKFLNYAGEVQKNITNSDVIESKNVLVLLLEESDNRNKIIDLEEWYDDDIIIEYQSNYGDIDLGRLNKYVEDIFKQIRGITKFPASEMKFQANLVNELSDEYLDIADVFENQASEVDVNIKSSSIPIAETNENNNANTNNSQFEYNDLINVLDIDNQINNLDELLDNDINQSENLSTFLFVESGEYINQYNNQIEDISIDEDLNNEMVENVVSARVNYNMAQTNSEFTDAYNELYNELQEIKKKNLIETLDDNDIEQLNNIAIKAEVIKQEQEKYFEEESYYTDELQRNRDKIIEVNTMIEEEYSLYDNIDSDIDDLEEEKKNLSKKGVKEVDKEIDVLQFSLDSVREEINYLEAYSVDLELYAKNIEQQSKITINIIQYLQQNKDNIDDDLSVDGDISRLNNEINKAYKRYNKDLNIDKKYDNKYFNADFLLVDNLNDVIEDEYQTQYNLFIINTNANNTNPINIAEDSNENIVVNQELPIDNNLANNISTEDNDSNENIVVNQELSIDNNLANISINSEEFDPNNATIEEINNRFDIINTSLETRKEDVEIVSSLLSKDLAENIISVSRAEISIIRSVLQNEDNPQKKEILNRRIEKLDSIIDLKEKEIELNNLAIDISNISLGIDYQTSNSLVDVEQIFNIVDSIQQYSINEKQEAEKILKEAELIEDEIINNIYIENAKKMQLSSDKNKIIADNLLIDAYQNKYQSLYIVYSSWQADIDYLTPDLEYALFNVETIMEMAEQKKQSLEYADNILDSIKIYTKVTSLYKQAVDELDLTLDKIEIERPDLHTKEDFYNLLESFSDNHLELSSNLYPEIEESVNDNTNQNTHTVNNTQGNNVNQINEENIDNQDLNNSLIFKVQIAASRKEVGNEYFPGVENLEVEKLSTSVYYRYMTGATKDIDEAFAIRNKMRTLTYKDAFVVAYLNGERISLAEARQHLNNTNQNNTIQNTELDNNLAENPIQVDEEKASGVTKVEDISGLCYSIQIGVYGGERDSKSLFGIKDLYYDRMQNGYYRYFSGTYTNYGNAINSRNIIRQKGITDAYIIAFYNGKKISVAQANELSNTINMGVKINGIDIENTELPQNIYVEAYLSVQIGAFSKEVPVETVNAFLSISSRGIFTHKLENGVTVYYTGKIKEKADIEVLRTTVINSGIEDAFIIGFIDGKKVSRAEAEKNL